MIKRRAVSKILAHSLLRIPSTFNLFLPSPLSLLDLKDLFFELYLSRSIETVRTSIKLQQYNLWKKQCFICLACALFLVLALFSKPHVLSAFTSAKLKVSRSPWSHSECMDSAIFSLPVLDRWQSRFNRMYNAWGLKSSQAPFAHCKI